MPIENNFNICRGILVYFFFLKICSILDVVEILPDNTLRIMSPESLFPKVIGKKAIYFFLGLFSIFKEIVDNI
jgi:hypothetical protein